MSRPAPFLLLMLLASSCGGSFTYQDPDAPPPAVVVVGAAAPGCVFAGVVSTEARDAAAATDDVLRRAEAMGATHAQLGAFAALPCPPLSLQSCTTMSAQAFVCGEAAATFKPKVRDPSEIGGD